jgi:hypothetical protein
MQNITLLARWPILPPQLIQEGQMLSNMLMAQRQIPDAARLRTKLILPVFLLAFVAITPRTVVSQSICTTTTIQLAESAYSIGRFPTMYELLNPCLPNGFTEKRNSVDAYRLVALSYVASDSLDMAKMAIKQMLRIDSGYRPNPDTDPPIYVNLVNDQVPSWYTFMWTGNSTSHWLGRVAVVGALIAVPILVASSTEPDLPGPPSTPSN